MKKDKAGVKILAELDAKINSHEKTARDAEAKAVDIDAAVFDLKAVNPNASAKVDNRTPQEIIDNIAAQGKIVAAALDKLELLLAETD